MTKGEVEIVQEQVLLRVMELVYRVGFSRGLSAWRPFHDADNNPAWDKIEEILAGVEDTIELSYGKQGHDDITGRDYLYVIAKTPWDKEGLEVVGIDKRLTE